MDEQARFEPEAVLAPRRAGRSRLAIALPAVALMGAVWVGLSGPNSAPTTADASHDVAGAPASNAPTPAQPTQATRPVAGYPSTVLGIEVRILADLDNSSASNDAVIALAGWYVARPALGCPASRGVDLPGFVAELGVDADICTFWNRSGLLVATPNPAGTMNVGGANDHPYGLQAPPAVSVILTPGVVVPPEVSDSSAGPAQVILVGRRSTSGRELVVDRVAWADGWGGTQTTSILPKLLDQVPQLSSEPRDRLVESAVGLTGAILMDTLVDQATLAAIDPAAARIVAETSAHGQRIWYRRALGPDPALDAPRWIAIDDATGDVIASGLVDIQLRPRLPSDGSNVLAGDSITK